MKFKFINRIISVIICLAIVVVSASAVMGVSALGAVIEDDFEGAAIKWTQDTESQPNSDCIITIGSGEQANKVFHPVRTYVPENLGDSNVYIYNGTWPEQRMTSVTGIIHAETVSTTFTGLVIVYYYKDADNWRGLCFTQEGTGENAQNIRFCGKENGVKNDFAAYATHIYGGTLTTIVGIDTRFTITYNSDGTASMVLTNSTGTSPAISLLTGAKKFAGRVFENEIKANEGQFAMANGGWVIEGEKDYFDDIAITFEATPADAAAAFKTTHSVILSKSVETVVEGDSSAILLALEDYSKLSDEARALLESQYNLLVDLDYTINSAPFSGASFTDNFSGEINWKRGDAADDAANCVTNDGKFLPPDAKKSNLGYEDLNVTEGYTKSFTPDIPIYVHKYWPRTRQLETVSGKYALTKQHYRGSLIIYYYKDINNWRGVYITNNGTNMHIKYLMKESDVLDEDIVYYAHTASTYYNIGAPSDGPFAYDTECNFVLSYEDDGKVILKLMQGENTVEAELPAAKEFTTLAPNISSIVYNKDAVYKSVDGGKTFTAMAFTHEKDNVTYYLSEQHTFTAINARNGQFAMGVGKQGSTFDDIKVSFVQTVDEKIQSYKDENAEILAKTTNSVSDGDKDALIKAINDYSALDSNTKEKLANEIEHLYELAYALDSNIQIFIDKYKDYWLKTESEITYYDREPLAQAIEDYDALSDFAKEILLDKKTLVDSFYSIAMNRFEPRPSDDYTSNFEADFENGVLPFRNVNTQSKKSVAQIETDPTDATGANHAFMMNVASNDNLLYVVCDELWNPQVQMKTISYRQYYESIGAFAPPIFIYDYVDKNNMKGVYFGYGGALMLRTWTDGIENAKILKAAPFFTDWSKTDTPEGWVNFTYTFGEDSVNLVVELPNGTTESIDLEYTAGARIAICMPSHYGLVGSNFYTDDIVVTMAKGDFDVNENIEDIVVYYSENTVIYPDETVLISGEKVGLNTSKVEIMRLEDKAPADTDKAGYIKEIGYDTTGEYDGTTQPISPSWDNNVSQNIDILQATKNSVKIVVPKEYEKGIYAVRITPKNTLFEPTIIYVNNPYIQFVMGDEGDISTRGGWVRIVGNNLLPTGDITNVRIQLKNDKGEIFNLPVTEYYDDDAYSLQANIPDDFEYGNYEVFVYNGWGDETAWSAPGKITIGASPRDSWPKEVFNVRDYGAVGNSDTNDTPAIVNALNAVAANGGGVLYFPKSDGAYRVVTTLAIPEKVVIKGDGIGNSQIMWTANRWQYGEVPPEITILGNVHITDIGLYSSRSAENITMASTGAQHSMSECTQHNADNIYITNVYIRNSWSAGFVSQGGGANVHGTGEMTIAEVSALVLKESASVPRIKIQYGGSKNLQIKNLDMDSVSSNAAGVFTDHAYSIIQDSVMQDWSVFSAKEALIFEDNDTTRGAVGANGSRMYFARNYMHDNLTNNRELFTIDGQPFDHNVAIQFVGQNEKLMGEGRTDNVTFRTVSASYKANHLIGFDLVVGSGQGLGQVRTIARNYNKDTSIELDVYKWEISEEVTFESKVKQLEEMYKTTAVSVTINGISAMKYEYKQENNGYEYTVVNYLLSDGERIIQISFWCDGSTREAQQMETTINSIIKSSTEVTDTKFVRLGDSEFYIVLLSNFVSKNDNLVADLIARYDSSMDSTISFIEVEEAFTVTPNRNSRVWVILPRHGWIFVDNNWQEGAACGSSGSMVDIVFDGNYFKLHGGQKFALRDGPNWYMTMTNQVFEDPWYMHGEGIGYDSTFNTHSRIQIHAMNSFCSEQIIGFTFRRNNFGEYYIYIDRAPFVNGIRDFILEKNTMYDVEYAILSNDTSATCFDGVLLRDNDFETKNFGMYTGTIFTTAGTEYNNLGYVRCLITQSKYDPSLLGDVNGDGKISLKDSTMIRYAVLELLVLNNDQKSRADVNADKLITLKDANKIRKYIIEGISFDDVSDKESIGSDSGNSDDWMDGIW